MLRRSDGVEILLEDIMDMRAVGIDFDEKMLNDPDFKGMPFMKVIESDGYLHFYDKNGKEHYAPVKKISTIVPDDLANLIRGI
jgi:hypothetical protein